jgi:hypothetical protein
MCDVVQCVIHIHTYTRTQIHKYTHAPKLPIQNAHNATHATHLSADQEGGTQRHAIGEVVRKVSGQVQPAARLNVCTIHGGHDVVFRRLPLIGGLYLCILAQTGLGLCLGRGRGRGGARLMCMGVRVRVAVAAVAVLTAYELLDHEEADDTGENPQASEDVVRVAFLLVVAGVRVRVRVTVFPATGCCVRQQMQKHIAQQTAHRKGEQHLQQRLLCGSAIVTLIVHTGGWYVHSGEFQAHTHDEWNHHKQ